MARAEKIPSNPGLSPSTVVAPRAFSARRTVLLCVALAVAIIALYARVHQYSYVNYDDGDYVTNNLQVQAGLTAATVHWAFTSYAAANWHPLTWLSHALDCQLFGLDPAGPHDVNVAFQIVNAWLLFLVLQRATRFTGRSFMVAALFALHPLNVESVVWISERKNLLSMFFFLLALGAYEWYSRNPRVGRYLVVALLFALGLMSKPQVITFPFVLLLWDYWPLGRMNFGKSEPAASSMYRPRTLGALVLEKVPLLALALGSALITMRAQGSGGATSAFPLSLRLENALVSYARYLGKAVWPSRLALFYPHPGGAALWQVYGSLLLLLAITFLAVESKRRYLIVGWLWFLGTLIPMIGLMQVGMQSMADRYAYLSYIGLFIMVCWGAGEWAEAKRIPASALTAAGVAALLALSGVSYRQIGYWNDNVTLWTHALEVTTRNWLAENNLARALMEEGHNQEAIPHFYRAAEIYPADPISNMNVATYEQQHGNFRAAIAHYEKVVSFARTPEIKAAALNGMGKAYGALGETTRAQACFAEAARIRGGR